MLPHPFGEVGVNIRFRADSERVQMVPWRERLHQSKARILQPPREHDVAVDPPSTRRHLGEGHADLKRDARFFWQYAHWADRGNGLDDAVEQSADLRRLAAKVMIEVVARGVRW